LRKNSQRLNEKIPGGVTRDREGVFGLKGREDVTRGEVTVQLRGHADKSPI